MPPSRRRLLRFGSVALAGSLAGCASGALKKRKSGGSNSTADTADSTTASDSTTHAVGADASLPEGTAEFPDGPKSRPERPADLTRASAREYVRSFEHRRVYNELYRDESTDIRLECGVDSISEYGAGFRVVVWCSAWANTDRNGTTVHADYFAQYATYFVGPDSTVRWDGKSRER